MKKQLAKIQQQHPMHADAARILDDIARANAFVSYGPHDAKLLLERLRHQPEHIVVKTVLAALATGDDDLLRSECLRLCRLYDLDLLEGDGFAHVIHGRLFYDEFVAMPE